MNIYYIEALNHRTTIDCIADAVVIASNTAEAFKLLKERYPTDQKFEIELIGVAMSNQKAGVLSVSINF